VAAATTIESPEAASDMACPIVLQAVWTDLQSLLSLPFTPSTYHVVEPGVVTAVAVTDLLNPAKARRRPTEQRANPIKRRELKKAAREVDFVFMDVLLFLF
jgi:hypothetical protein